jgi:hypothetical protein
VNAEPSRQPPPPTINNVDIRSRSAQSRRRPAARRSDQSVQPDERQHDDGADHRVGGDILKPTAILPPGSDFNVALYFLTISAE